jgi:aldehyde oxidoreductase
VLLDLLRDDLDLTGAKQSCDRKGQCGACTVIVNNKAVRSCLAKVKDLDGAEVITVEGLGTPDNPHLIQEAFVLAGAVQCGFCTPGMILGAKALLDRNPDPSPEQIKKALRRNLCRCTGYKKIVEAVLLAGRFLRGEIAPEALRPDPAAGMIGVSHPRPTGLARACGTAKFTADYKVPGALELAVVRAPHAHARILSIDTAPAEALPGVVGVMTAKDVKGTNRIKYLKDDQPLLCEDKVRVLGDPLAVVAAQTKTQAEAGAAAVKVEYELLPAVSTVTEALAENAPQVHDGQPNLCFSQPQIKGDAGAALAGSAFVVESDFSTQMIHQSPLEPEASVAYLEGEGDEAKLVVVGRGINIHHHRMVLQEALGWEDIRYEEAYSGGQFGIKLDITTEGLAGAAALHFKRPVRYVCSLTEAMWITSKRHPLAAHLRLGADGSGRLTGFEVEYFLENGAYTSWGNAIVLRILQMLSGAYNIPHVKALGQLVYTNNAWGGAARGAGPPQINFALESAMDMLARRAGQDPLEFRLANSLQPGETTSSGQAVEEWAIPGCIEALRPRYERARAESAAFQPGRLRRGVGVACGSFGIGKAGPGDKSTVAVELDDDGGLTVFASAADPGEGNDAMLTQIAAHLMSLPPDKIRLVTRDTDRTPDSSSASGSRVTYMTGGALVEAIGALKAALAEVKAKTAADLEAAGKPRRYLGTKTQSTTGLDPKTGQGIPYDSRVHGAQMAEVEVDTETGEVKIIRMTAVVDPGRVLNPTLVEAQMEGGLDMGAGMALREKYVHGQTTDWVSFKFPTMATALDTEIVLVETPRRLGALGAVGVGEFVMLPTAAAIMNAIEDATGARVRHLPATPEAVLEALAAVRP